MKPVAVCFALLCLAGAVSAQVITRSFGSVVFPGGTSATTPGVTRNFGSVVFPGGAAVPPVHMAPPVMAGTPRYVNPPVGGQNFRRSPSVRSTRGNSFVYAYPVFVGGYDTSMFGGEPVPAAAVPPQPAPGAYYPPESARPVMIQVGPDYPSREPMSAYQPPAAADETQPSSERYLLAFKDHTVYSAVAYWFDGDTLHYFTPGNVHNQVSISLIDRDLTTRLNKELGIEFHMPQGK